MSCTLDCYRIFLLLLVYSNGFMDAIPDHNYAHFPILMVINDATFRCIEAFVSISFIQVSGQDLSLEVNHKL